jgi:hypothetical protein
VRGGGLVAALVCRVAEHPWAHQPRASGTRGGKCGAALWVSGLPVGLVEGPRN